MPAAIGGPVRLPLTGTRDTQVEAAILRHARRPARRSAAARRARARVPTRPTTTGPGGSDFGRALELARFLGDGRLAGVKTVAWLPEGCDRACGARGAGLRRDRDAGRRGARPGQRGASRPSTTRCGPPTCRSPRRRRTVPPAVALALLDPAARVVRVSTDDGEQFVAERDLDALKREAAVLAVESCGPCRSRSRPPRPRTRVRAAPRAHARPNSPAGSASPSDRSRPTRRLEGGWKAAQVVARRRRSRPRPSPGARHGSTRRSRTARTSSACGSTARGRSRAEPRARHLARGPRSGARADRGLGAAGGAGRRGARGPGLRRTRDAPRPPCSAARGPPRSRPPRRRDRGGLGARAWRKAAADPGRCRSALVAPGLVVHRATQQGYRPRRLLQRRRTRRRATTARRWQLGPTWASGRSSSTAAGREARARDARRRWLRRRSRQAYGLEGRHRARRAGLGRSAAGGAGQPEPRLAVAPDRRRRAVHRAQTPGIGFGGFVSMVAFIVYFWSQYLHGTSGWLEVMLFLAGLFCLAAEIFVLPGFGVLGPRRRAARDRRRSCSPASRSCCPTNDYQIRQMQWSLLGILGAAVGVALLGVLAAPLAAGDAVSCGTCCSSRRPTRSTPRIAARRARGPAGHHDHAARAGRQGADRRRRPRRGQRRPRSSSRGRPVQVVDVRGGRIVVRPVGADGSR